MCFIEQNVNNRSVSMPSPVTTILSARGTQRPLASAWPSAVVIRISTVEKSHHDSPGRASVHRRAGPTGWLHPAMCSKRGQNAGPADRHRRRHRAPAARAHYPIGHTARPAGRPNIAGAAGDGCVGGVAFACKDERGADTAMVRSSPARPGCRPLGPSPWLCGVREIGYVPREPPAQRPSEPPATPGQTP